jgi:subtilisin family serine protease
MEPGFLPTATARCAEKNMLHSPRPSRIRSRVAMSAGASASLSWSLALRCSASVALLLAAATVPARATPPSPWLGSHHVPLSTLRTAFRVPEGWNDEILQSAMDWQVDWVVRARSMEDWPAGPHIGCTSYGNGPKAARRLREWAGQESVRTVHHSREGKITCFLIGLSDISLESLLGALEYPQDLELDSFSPLPSAIRISERVLLSPESAGQGLSFHDRGVKDLLLDASSPGSARKHEVAAFFRKRQSEEWQRAESDHHGRRNFELDFHEDMMWQGGNPVGLALTLSPGALAWHGGGGSALWDAWAERWARASQHDNFWLDGSWNDPSYVTVKANVERWTAAAASGCEEDEWGAVLHFEQHGEEHIQVSGLGKLRGGAVCALIVVGFLSAQPEIARISSQYVVSPFNAVAAPSMQGGPSSHAVPLWDAGLDGAGQVVGVADTGIDMGSCFFNDPLLPHDSTHNVNASEHRKIAQYVTTWANEHDSFGGHGTHVAGSIAGSILPTHNVQSQCHRGDKSLALQGKEEPSLLHVTCLGECYAPSNITHLEKDSEFTLDLYCPEFQCDGDGLRVGSKAVANDWTAEFGMPCLQDAQENLPRAQGMAPRARLAFLDAEDDEGNFNPPWPETTPMFEHAYAAGARIHSDSWGTTGRCRDYGDGDRSVDQFSWNHPDFLVIVASGNDGDWGGCTVGSPGSAKNALTVGASNSGPERGEPNVDLAADFSSRGPTEDGRIKPEIVVPGNYVLSASSMGPGAGSSCKLEFMAGTSMSTPLVAGSAALVRQYLMDGYYSRVVQAQGLCGLTRGTPYTCRPMKSPSGMLLKALLINGADRRAAPGEYDLDIGFGHLTLNQTLPGLGPGPLEDDIVLYFDDGPSANMPESSYRNYTVSVDRAGSPFRATLVWFDPPGHTLSTRALLHDLDLKVIGPNGMMYLANGRTNTVSADYTNTVERVTIADPDIGIYTVQVEANLLPELDGAGQPYALVITANGVVSSVSQAEDLSDPEMDEKLPDAPTPMPTRSTADRDRIEAGCPNPEFYDWLGDGVCDDIFNVASCGFDEGDCCESTCEGACSLDWCVDPGRPEYICDNESLMTLEMNLMCNSCTAPIQLWRWAGDGLCDSMLNSEECNWDGGDCCPSTCSGLECGRAGYDCLAPSVPESICSNAPKGDDAALCEAGCPVTLMLQLEKFRNGICDEDWNRPDCLWDGGDCCPDTCDGGSEEVRWNRKQPGGETDHSFWGPSSGKYTAGCLGSFVCFDPESAHSKCATVPTLCDTCMDHAEMWGSLGDGTCNPELNTARCLNDGGDCDGQVEPELPNLPAPYDPGLP